MGFFVKMAWFMIIVGGGGFMITVPMALGIFDLIVNAGVGFVSDRVLMRNVKMLKC